MSRLFGLFFLVIMLGSLTMNNPCVSCAKPEVGKRLPETELKSKSSKSELLSCLKIAIEVLKKVTSILSKLGSVFGDFRQANAVLDCLDLLDLAADELSSVISASQNSNGKDNSTGDVSSDLKTWASAALSDLDTCVEGFLGTNGFVKRLVTSGLNEAISLVRKILTMVHDHNSVPTAKRNRSSTNGFPSWVKPGDRNLLQQVHGNDTGAAADVVVALDGTGNFTKISDAVLAAPDCSTDRYVIYVKKGVYEENVEIKKKKWNLMIVGDGIDATVITGKRSFGDGWTTFRSATFAVSARGFIAKDITFENTAGPEKHQAVALRSDSDLSVFFRCAMRGYQDTLYTHTMRQFYRECTISGTVDFIFGDATTLLQNCSIRAISQDRIPNQKNVITAQGRKDPNQPTGFVIQFCNITAEDTTYLGRPWKMFSRTVLMENYIGGAVKPEGWLEWDGKFGLDTLYYGEYMNSGPGAMVGGRVKWPGYHVMNSSEEADSFTVSKFIEGDLWLPATGVRYTAGLRL